MIGVANNVTRTPLEHDTLFIFDNMMVMVNDYLCVLNNV